MSKPTGTSEIEFNRQNEQAVRAAREADQVEPRATSVTYGPDQALVLAHLRSGFAFGFPPERIPGLGKATRKQLSNVRIAPSGDGLHWDDNGVNASLQSPATQSPHARWFISA